MATGTIILLNGTSSAGKTSLIKALQQVLDEPYLNAGIDKFLWMLPPRYLEQPLWSEVFQYTWPADGSPTGLTITAGPLSHRLMSGMHQAIAVLAATGNNVLADHVLLERRWLQECAELFSDFRAFLVAVRCPLEVVEQREKERQDRTVGQARAYFHRVHAHSLYDLEIDTSLGSPMDCALKIKGYLEHGQPPWAFRAIREGVA